MPRPCVHVRSWGTACFVGERGQVTLDVSADLLRRQVTLVGSWTFSKQGQDECAEFIAERKVDVERLFTRHCAMSASDPKQTLSSPLGCNERYNSRSKSVIFSRYPM